MTEHPQSQPKGDLVRRLRAYHSKIMTEAADRIEFLEGQVEGLNESFSSIAEVANTVPSLRSQVSELRGVLHWIEAHDRFWTSPEYEKGNEVLERADHNIKIRGAYGAAANVALKALALHSQDRA